MALILYNTKTRKLEAFTPITPGKVGMYTCGPTVYGPAHIGNLRAYVFADLLKRTLIANGYAVEHVINITDIGHLVGDGDEGEDRMTKALKRENLPLTMEAMYQLGTRYLEKFKDDIEKLSIITPTVLPRAADHIQEDIALVAILIEKGFTYATNDGIYFDTTKMSTYGEFARLPKEEATEEHQRIVNSKKKNSRDFALWKFDAELGYEAPFGHGFPGWHIECSAMAMKYLGETFDIHTGGIDHIPVHHQNEIAQSESATGKEYVRYWLHNNFLNVGGEKISKSLKNDIILDEIIAQGIAPAALRLFFLTAQYQSFQNFTWDALNAAQKAWNKISAFMMQENPNGSVNDTYYALVLEKMNNNLNTPEALAVLWDLFKADIPAPEKRATLVAVDKLLGLGLETIPQVTVPPEVAEKLRVRNSARENKNYTEADALRAEIRAEGFDIIDTESGSFAIPAKK
ncbi:MAG TPA: cysteine--tRNA ligase [Candidatus Paceibacterota bacterium]|nr:cysteine--tRNA ligase [Candidatus Paceibacterota bacterium]